MTSHNLPQHPHSPRRNWFVERGVVKAIRAVVGAVGFYVDGYRC